MIAIADSGSTKTDWVLLDNNHSEAFRVTTIGLNPYFVSTEQITQELKKNNDLQHIANTVTQVYFYGAGCSADYLKKQVNDGLKNYFKNASILVSHDLLAACYASYRGKPSIVCILGTGSNACYFDGKKIHEETPSLAYILGDEGSGNHLGKKLLRAYFTKKLPNHLATDFHKEYNLSVTELNKNVYQNQFANTYLASFSKFVYKHKQDPYIQNLIFESMLQFFEYQVLPYHEAHNTEINFIGSVAHYYESIIKSAAAKFHLTVGQIVQKPIDNIIDYHKKYILN